MLSTDPSNLPSHGGSDLERLQQRVQELENRLDANPLGRANADSWFFSDSFLKRAFAVLGHYFVASLLIALPFYCIIFFIMPVAQ
ncbi:MAG: hypothetical protein KDE46_27460 [Caldilineaceae bacterium]|nr:hypothetical protein [Caldilineaceae bacterium]